MALPYLDAHHMLDTDASNVQADRVVLQEQRHKTKKPKRLLVEVIDKSWQSV